MRPLRGLRTSRLVWISSCSQRKDPSTDLRRGNGRVFVCRGTMSGQVGSIFNVRAKAYRQGKKNPGYRRRDNRGRTNEILFRENSGLLSSQRRGEWNTPAPPDDPNRSVQRRVILDKSGAEIHQRRKGRRQPESRALKVYPNGGLQVTPLTK